MFEFVRDAWRWGGRERVSLTYHRGASRPCSCPSTMTSDTPFESSAKVFFRKLGIALMWLCCTFVSGIYLAPLWEHHRVDDWVETDAHI